MSAGPYRHIEAFIEQHQINRSADWLCQPVTVMMVGDGETPDPAVCRLAPAQARNLAFELLVEAEHAERLTRSRGAGR